MASKLKGGKTPPRLLDDLNLYNPHNLPPSGYNILTELAYPYDENKTPPKRVGKRHCRHKWALKPSTSSTSLLDPPTTAESRTTAALCITCRCHVSLEISFPEDSSGSRLCPTEAYPLHHLVYVQRADPFLREEGRSVEHWEDRRYFRCSANGCPLHLTVRMRSPRLDDRWIDALTNKAQVTKRANEAIATDPARFEGHAVPSAIDVISNLKTYIGNVMKGEDRTIPKHNKKWMLCFGESCTDLFTVLRFTQTDTDLVPPRLDPSDLQPFSSELKVLLDDVDKELTSVIAQHPEEQHRVTKAYMPLASSANEFNIILGSKDYMTSLASRTQEKGDDEHPFYAGLGTVLDFHDSLISFAYDRQVDVDSSNGPYYLESLQGIAEGRKSEDLQTKVAIEASNGKVSLKDVREAYKAFGFEFEQTEYDEDTIIGTFQSRIADAPRQESALRRSLTIIGQHRNSPGIQQIASNTVSTPEQALSWLGATADMNEEFIVTMYGVKVGDNAASEELGRKCISMIAEQRNSEALRNWLNTGQLGKTEMDHAHAYARLSISEENVEDELVITSYELAIQDAPSQASVLKQALEAIARHRNSSTLKSYCAGGLSNDQHRLSEWPVGLQNIGNTCYLNSLLQLFFTIQPLRKLVLEFESKYKMDITAANMENKQVGSRKVSIREVERSQLFVRELAKLFVEMITSDKREVAPEVELARLALVSTTVEESLRRRSTVTGARPSLGDIDGKAIQGPLPPAPAPHDSTADAEPLLHNGTAVRNNENIAIDVDLSSEGTLIDQPPATPEEDFMVIDPIEQAQAFEDKENLSPTKELAPSTASESHLQPLGETSPSRTNEQRPTSPTKAKSIEDGFRPAGSATQGPASGPPNRPPPIPPRHKSEDHLKVLKDEAEFAAQQQDVTEAISNVLFQLQCAINADGHDEATGEQVDLVKRLFFGKQKVTTTDKHGKSRTKEEYFSDIKVQMSGGPLDIYEALDTALDEQEVEVSTWKEPQHTTISTLPPILQIHVNRASYNKENNSSFKSVHHLTLEETIYLDRYLDSEDEELNKRRKDCWAWKRAVAKMEKRLATLKSTSIGRSAGDTFGLLGKYLEQVQDKGADSIEVKPSVLEDVKKLSGIFEQEADELEPKIKDLREAIKSQFVDLRSEAYNLHSVIMHRGGVSSGHYWIFIYDHSQKIWRNYNDGYVTEVTSLAEIFDQGDATRPTTAAFVVYIKADHEQELSESVCREVREREVPADRQYHSGFQPNFIDGTPMEVDEIEAYEQTPDPNDPNAVDW